MSDKAEEKIVEEVEIPEVVPTEQPDLSHEMAAKLMDAAKKNDSILDPGGKIMYKTLAELRKESLPPVTYNWEKIAQMIFLEMKKAVEQEGQKAEEIKISLRVQESMFTKKNRIRLVPGDHSSPLGVILKGDEEANTFNKPYAVAIFFAQELFRYAANQLEEKANQQPAKTESSETVGG